MGTTYTCANMTTDSSQRAGFRRGTKPRLALSRCFALASKRILGAFLAITLSISSHTVTTANAVDVGKEARENGEGRTECLEYQNDTFTLTCNFTWDNHYDEDDYIFLQANEIFNGNDYVIDLDGCDSWEGLFRINSTIQWENAPIIKHLHVISGETSYDGGFIVQSDQKNFVVDSCSSSGTIDERGGGVCGHQCSGTILLSNCWSTGLIKGHNTGGITGRLFGFDQGKVNITNCWSEGVISGDNSGGICGSRVGENGGIVTITTSYSKGDVRGPTSGGICGAHAGENNAHVKISQCFTLGKISGDGSGGITGSRTGINDGLVEITNCYTRGDITGGRLLSGSAGGICGTDTGQNNGVVHITNVYASGDIENNQRGGIIGHIHSSANEVNITMSVHNGEPMIGTGSVPQASQNSNDLNSITGKVYCYKEGICWDTTTVWKATDDLPMLLAEIPPSMPPTPSAANKSTLPVAPTTTLSPTASSTQTAKTQILASPSSTPTGSPSLTLARSTTSTETGTLIPTSTAMGNSSSNSVPEYSETPSPQHKLKQRRRIELPIQCRKPNRIINAYRRDVKKCMN